MRLDLPEVKAFARPDSYSGDIDPRVMERWNGALRLEASAGNAVFIDMFETIGEDFWTGGGITAKRVSDQLKGAGDVVVNINSPGGDYFEGIAIYNVLRLHPGQVTINVVGMAASAASVILMAGNTRRVAEASFVMIHNVWGLVMGDRHDLQDAIDLFEPFDATAAEIYAKATGQKLEQISAWCDNETWFTGREAVANGFADVLLEPDAVREDARAKAEGRPLNAVRQIDSILGQYGKTRSERRALLNLVRRGTHDAAALATQDAGLSNAVQALRDLTKSFSNN